MGFTSVEQCVDFIIGALLTDCDAFRDGRVIRRIDRVYPEQVIEKCNKCGKIFDAVIHRHTPAACREEITDNKREAGILGWTARIESDEYDEQSHWKRNLGTRLSDGFLMMQDDDMPYRETFIFETGRKT